MEPRLRSLSLSLSLSERDGLLPPSRSQPRLTRLAETRTPNQILRRQRAFQGATKCEVNGVKTSRRVRLALSNTAESRRYSLFILNAESVKLTRDSVELEISASAVERSVVSLANTINYYIPCVLWDEYLLRLCYIIFTFGVARG
jgi:hypothetical protein